MNTTVRNLSLVALMAFTAACSQPSNNVKKLDVSSILGENKTPAEKAEDIALAGEQLMTAGAFMYADHIFALALDVDAANPRANLLKRIIAPAMRMKGMATRIRPLLTEQAKADLDKSIAQYPNSAVKTFITEGSEDIRSESDVQKVLDGVIEDFDSLRVHLKNTKDQSIVLHLPSEFQHDRFEDVTKKNCNVSETSSNVYQIDCDLSGAFEFTMDRADKEALQQIVAGYQVYMSVANAYSQDGMIALSKIDDETKKQPDFLQNYLRANPQWGLLRNPRLLSSVIDMGVDAVKGVRWAQANQATLCPNRAKSDGSRPGHVFSDGFCIENTAKTARILAMVEAGLNGATLNMPIGDGSSGQIQVRPAQTFAHPIADLKTQLPVQTDECGRLVTMPDPTVGGLFPNGDVNRLFNSNCPVRY